VLKRNNCQLITLPSKTIIQTGGEVKPSHHKQKVKQYESTKPVLRTTLKEIPHIEEEDKCNHENIGKKKSD
jgi:hypothetical protein